MDTLFQFLTNSLKLPIPLVYSLFSFVVPLIFINLVSNFTKFGKYLGKRFVIVLYSLLIFRFLTDWKSGSLQDQLNSIMFVAGIFLITLVVNFLIGKFVAINSEEFYKDKKTLILNVFLILLLSSLENAIFQTKYNFDILSLILTLYLINTCTSYLLENRKSEFGKYLLMNLILIISSYLIVSWQSFSTLIIQSTWVILLLIITYFVTKSDFTKKLYLPKLKDLE